MSARKLIFTLSAALFAFAMSNGNAVAAPADVLEIQQQISKIEGNITDKQDGTPIVGATVRVKETGQGVLSGMKGNFSIDAEGGKHTLVITYVGYKPMTIPASKGFMDIKLEADAVSLGNVVIVGYGSQKKENLTGAVVSVNVDETLGSRPIADVGRGLQGAVAGLTVTIPSGEVGSEPKMNIRGQFGSLAGKNNPLILLDNVEIPSIQMVNPNDVEAISVLKDAASASIYGAKAAFGVILITTKKGAKKESVSVSYNANLSWQNPAKKLEMGGIDAIEYTLLAAKRSNTSPAGGFWRINDESFARIKEWQEKYSGEVNPNDPLVYNRDWYWDGTNKFGVRLFNPYDHMVKKWAPTQNHSLSVIGKSGNTNYNIGLGYLDQSGMTKPAKHDDFRRYNFSANVSSDVSKFLTVRAGMLFANENKRFPAYSTYTSGSADPWLYIYRWSPLYPVGVTDEAGNNLKNPVFEIANTNTANQQKIYMSANVGATLNFTSNWDLKVDYTYVNSQGISNKSVPTFYGSESWFSVNPRLDAAGNPVFVDAAGNVTDPSNEGAVPAYNFPAPAYYKMSGAPATDPDSYINRSSGMTNKGILNAYSTYNLTINENHVFKFMVGMNRIEEDSKSNFSMKGTLLDFNNPQFPFAVGREEVNGESEWESQLGFFGRVNYIIANKYLFEANFRRDGSSKFPTHLKWKSYPSASVGWIISEENFLKPHYDIVSFAKIRASWGSIGDQSVSNTLYVPILNPYKGMWLSANQRDNVATTPNAVSRDITWQNIVTLDLGVDFRFIKNKLGVTFDWFQRDTKDMIIPGDDIPFTAGYSAPQGNYGNARTKGWEVAIDFNHKFKNGLGINVSGTLADAQSFMTKGPDHRTLPENRLISNVSATGRRIGDFWGYKVDRIYKKEDFVWKEDGTIKTIKIIYKGSEREVNMLAGDNPNYQNAIEAGSFNFGPGDVRFHDLNGDGYITPGIGTNGDPGDRAVIGNSTPRFGYGLRVALDYKAFDFSVFFQGIGSRQIWGGGQIATPGYNAKEGAMPQAIAGNFWREDRTDAFYPRPWDYGGELGTTTFIYGNMVTNDRYMLDMSYLRIKNITLGYSLPQNFLRKISLTDVRIYVSLENFFTFDHLNGMPIDPEVISGYSMFNEKDYNGSRTGTGIPTFKTASVGLQVRF